jgi:G3E family GTPase
MVLLQSGCLCCTIRGDLSEAMRDLYDRRERGLVPAFDRLVIETTGLADPAPIVATLMNDPVIRYHFRLSSIVTVVDAKNGCATLEDYEESRKQVAVADRIVISKTDIAAPAEVARLETQLGLLNRTAVRLEAARGPLSASELLASDVYDPKAKSQEVHRWLMAEEQASQEEHGAHRHDVNRHGSNILASCMTLDVPLEWPAFAIWLTMLLNRHGQNILRLKGLLNIAGVSTPVVIHGVQHTIHPPSHLDAWPDDIARTQIVFITKGIEGTQLQASLEAFNGVLAKDRHCGT